MAERTKTRQGQVYMGLRSQYIGESKDALRDGYGTYTDVDVRTFKRQWRKDEFLG